MSFSIEQIDPHNEPALKAWWEVGRAATAGRASMPWPVWEHVRSIATTTNPERALVFLAAIDGREMVGAALVAHPLLENTHGVELELYVRPDRRREGVGTALLAEAEALTRGAGRTTVWSAALVPPGGTAPGEAFARARGFDVASRESMKELDTADYRARRQALLDAVGGASDGYEIVTFDTVCPEEHLASFGRLLGMLNAEIPLGDLDLADSEWTPERMRAAEQRQVAIGRHVLTAIALAPDGTVAGASDVRVNDTSPTQGQVGITLVDPAHRGHRLGLALKVATHDLALASYPGLRSVETSNAEVNTHMNAVNEQLGYRTLETVLELQKKL